MPRFRIAGRDYDHESELRDRLRKLHGEYPDDRFPDDVREEWNEICKVTAEFDARRERIREAIGRPANREGEPDGDTRTGVRQRRWRRTFRRSTRTASYSAT